MTKEQFKELKAGDIIKTVDNQKEIVVGKFNKDDDMLWLDIYNPIRDVHAWLPYYYWELELISSDTSKGKCTCDFFKVILVKGCQCGGI